MAATRVLPLWIALVGLAGATAALQAGSDAATVVSGEAGETAEPVDGDVSPEPGDPVEPITTTPDPSTTTTTALGPVDVTIEVGNDGVGTRPETTVPGGSEPLPTTTPPLADLLPPAPEGFAWVRARVVDEAGQPVVGACVRLFPFQGGPVEQINAMTVDVVTGPDGAFATLVGIPDRPPTYPADIPPLVSMVPRSCSLPPEFFGAGGVADMTRSDVWTIRVERTAALAGRLELDGRPIGGLCVRAWTTVPVAPGPGPELGEGWFEVTTVYVTTTTSAADGTFRLPGMVPHQIASLIVAARCDGPAGDHEIITVGADHMPTGSHGIVGERTQQVGPPGSTVTIDVAGLRSEGDHRGDAPMLPHGPFLPVEMVMAGASQDDPVASCAPEATGPTVWRLPRYSGDRILWRTEFVGDAVVAVYEVVDGSLVELACTRSPAGQVAQGMWRIPAGSILLIRGLAGPTWGNLSFGPI